MNEAKANLTLKQRQRLQGKVQSEQKPEKQGSGKELPRIVSILLLLLAFGVGTALGMIYSRPDPALQEMEDMQAIMADPYTPGDLQRELGGERRELAESLPANLREKAGFGRGEDRIGRFFAKSSAEQLAELQARVAREKEWEARRAEMEADAAAKPADSSQANGNGNNNNGNGGGRGGKNDQQKVQRQEQRLANSQPQQRAQGGLMRQMMTAVRQQASR